MLHYLESPQQEEIKHKLADNGSHYRLQTQADEPVSNRCAKPGAAQAKMIFSKSKSAALETEQAPGYCSNSCRFFPPCCIGKVIAGERLTKYLQEERGKKKKKKIKDRLLNCTSERSRDVTQLETRTGATRYLMFSPERLVASGDALTTLVAGYSRLNRRVRTGKCSQKKLSRAR